VVSIPWTVVAAIAVGSLLVVGLTTVATTYAALRQPPVHLTAARE
jgi:hypothetical protein